MWELTRAYWCFLPYFALVSFLAVMSVRERPGKKDEANR
jgi:hypothetical protein